MQGPSHQSEIEYSDSAKSDLEQMVLSLNKRLQSLEEAYNQVEHGKNHLQQQNEHLQQENESLHSRLDTALASMFVMHQECEKHLGK